MLSLPILALKQNLFTEFIIFWLNTFIQDLFLEFLGIMNVLTINF